MRKPAIAFPCHDPEGWVLSLLEGVTPQLKELFALAFVGVTPETVGAQPESMAWLRSEAFFHVRVSREAASVGEQFHDLYCQAAESCPPEQVLHLCFPDRLVFVLLGPESDAFRADMRADDSTPLLYQRSPAAWATHPQNYRIAESVITQLGMLILGRELDFCWCHLVLTAQRLREIHPHLRAQSLAIMAEMVLSLRDDLETSDVDWLAWEDPLILGRDATTLKSERDCSGEELSKRLDYVEPMAQVLFDFARQREAACRVTAGC